LAYAGHHRLFGGGERERRGSGVGPAGTGAAMAVVKDVRRCGAARQIKILVVRATALRGGRRAH
jgi:hypothetical protein